MIEHVGDNTRDFLDSIDYRPPFEDNDDFNHSSNNSQANQISITQNKALEGFANQTIFTLNDRLEGSVHQVSVSDVEAN